MLMRLEPGLCDRTPAKSMTSIPSTTSALATPIRLRVRFRHRVKRLWRHALRRPRQQPQTELEEVDFSVRPLAALRHGPTSLSTPSLCRQTSKVGAVCGKAARTVLSGGCFVRSIPTGTLAASRRIFLLLKCADISFE